MKGILLAGGHGRRLYPLTLAVSKQLLPVYDKPLIYYPLSVLMLADVREILIITTAEDQPAMRRLLGDGSQLGCHFEFAIQPQPRGVAEALILGESFIGDDHIALILGDNIFYGSGLGQRLRDLGQPRGGVIFAAPVQDPQRYGVVEFAADGRVQSLEEKPTRPKSRFAVPGLYFYDSRATEIARSLGPSVRGELEITAVNQEYLRQGELRVHLLNRGVAWLDAGTFQSLNDASTFVRVIEERQGTKIGCIEEVAYYRKFIDDEQLCRLSAAYDQSGYGAYLRQLLPGS